MILLCKEDIWRRCRNSASVEQWELKRSGLTISPYLEVDETTNANELLINSHCTGLKRSRIRKKLCAFEYRTILRMKLKVVILCTLFLAAAVAGWPKPFKDDKGLNEVETRGVLQKRVSCCPCWFQGCPWGQCSYDLCCHCHDGCWKRWGIDEHSICHIVLRHFLRDLIEIVVRI